MNLGNFSVSLNVKNLEKSTSFYEALGFVEVSGNRAHNYCIMRNDTVLIGLYENMLDNNILTFNPKWNIEKETIDTPDVRKIEAVLKAHDIKIVTHVEGDSGPGYMILKDPDGNTLMFDQHV